MGLRLCIPGEVLWGSGVRLVLSLECKYLFFSFDQWLVYEFSLRLDLFIRRCVWAETFDTEFPMDRL